jgi:hypothetical protein
MARLPVVKLRHKKTGKTKIVNQTAYAADFSKWHDWKLISMRHGDASDAQVIFDAEQAEIERFRQKDTQRQKWSGDAQRDFEQRAVRATSFIMP